MKREIQKRLGGLAHDAGGWVRGITRLALQGRGPGSPGEVYPERHRQQERRLVQRLHPRSMALRVLEARDAAAGCRTLVLERTDGPLPPFRPGQYLNLVVTVDGVRTSRPYSIASAPGEPLEITVKEKPGGFVSPFLCARKPGDELQSSGPQGWFRREPLVDPERVVMLAGGSGVTPFMSMIRHSVAPSVEEPRGRITLLHGCRGPGDLIYGEELTRLARRHEHLGYHPVLSEAGEDDRGERGLLDAARIRRLGGDPAGVLYFVCGPEAMIPFCRAALDELGVPRHRVRAEAFGPPEDITRAPGWPEGVNAEQRFRVEVAGRPGISAAAGEPLLCALEREGLVLPALCRVGTCGACRTRLLQGQVYSPPGAGVRQCDHQAGYIHPCQSYPTSDLMIRLP